jgi:cellulose synthase (UDP-forming)
MLFPSPQDFSSALVFDAGTLITLLVLAGLLSRDALAARLIFGGVAAAIILTYAAWRWYDTMPPFEWTIASVWPHVYFGFEATAIGYTLLSIMILLRWIDRSAEADKAEVLLTASNEWPAVDVFICTYNEPIDVIEKSIIPALAIDYPNYTVWVLDDTRRPWLQDYCERVGARYITRPGNKGAKAGNLNNGLRHTATQTNAPLILVLDADFAPSRNILRRTVGLFEDPRAAVIQTPQFFYNSDPIQHNLTASQSWVDDQRIFFDVFQPAKDAWGCAFCVGTSFIVRRDCLEAIGGFPEDAICEDINLTYQLMPRGLETHWLNERLSVGLSAEGLPEYITQRTRWCLGTMQVALLSNGPFRGRGYTCMQRLHYFHGMLNWFCKPFIVLMLVAPSLYWVFGLPAFYADYLSFLRYGLPALFALWIYSGWVSGQRTLPLFMEVTHTLAAPAVALTLISAMVRPFGRPFKVTDKGGDRSLSTVRVKMALIFGSVSFISAGSIIWSMTSPYAASEISPIDLFNLIWAGVAMVLTFMSFLVCFERPRHDERFAMDEPAAVALADGVTMRCTLDGLFMASAALRFDEACHIDVGDVLRVFIAEVGLISASVVERDGGTIVVTFQPPEKSRAALIVRLFSTPPDHIASQATLRGAFTALFRRAFRAA